MPPLALRLPARKIAAGGALAAGAFYLALSGGNVATERAFVMVAVMLCAVMLDRRAIILRAVAVAAVIVLTCCGQKRCRGPGFQMSFAATVALVAAFGAMRAAAQALPRAAVAAPGAGGGLSSSPWRGWPRCRSPRRISTRSLSSVLIANLATAPPVMGTLVMPAGVLGRAPRCPSD